MRLESDLRPIPVLDLMTSKGGLGDAIARMPAVNYILVNYQHVKLVRLYVQDYFIPLAEHLLSAHVNSRRLKVFGYSQMETELKARPSQCAMMTDSEHHTTLRTHLTDHAFHTLADYQPEIEWKNYLNIYPKRIKQTSNNFTPKRKGDYIVITTGFTAPVREWLPAEINKVIHWCVENNYLPVFLGKTESVFWGNASTQGWFRENIAFDQGLNLIDKTDLLEAAKIMAGAAAVVGLDNGLLHLAGCTDVPIVAAYTTVEAKHRAPYRKNKLGWNMYIIEPPKDLKCRFCQTQTSFVYNFDYRNCYYNDYKCLPTITGEAFIKGLKEVLYVRTERQEQTASSLVRREIDRINNGSSVKS